MLAPGVPVIACVSGGTDSMCLLDVLGILSAEARFPLYAAHFNHRLRGGESDGDEAFVRAYCEKLGVPVFTGSGDVAGEAKKRGLGIEETARELRYRFFYRLSDRLGGARIATAHNADDNLETVLMRLARGAGLRGLCGIPPVSGRVIRPLLGVTRDMIEAWNRERSIPHREDSTNASDGYTRNRLRHSVVPVLKELNPALNVRNMTELLRRDEEYLSSLAESFLAESSSPGSVAARDLAALPYPVASRAVRRLFGEKLSTVHVNAVLALAESADPSGEVRLPGVTVRREYGLLTAVDPGPETFPETKIPLDRPVIIENIGLTITCEPCGEVEIYNSLTNFLIKWDKIKTGLYARPRRTGDALRLPGGTRSVKRLMIDRRIPARLRGALPVFVSDGEVLAVWGLGQSVDSLPAKGEPAILIKTEKTEGQ